MGTTNLPIEDGGKAYLNKTHYKNNPYPEGDWRNDEWWIGWLGEEGCDCGFDWKSDKFKKENIMKADGYYMETWHPVNGRLTHIVHERKGDIVKYYTEGVLVGTAKVTRKGTIKDYECVK